MFFLSKLPKSVFEPQTPGVGNDRSANSATDTDSWALFVYFCPFLITLYGGL